MLGSIVNRLSHLNSLEVLQGSIFEIEKKDSNFRFFRLYRSSNDEKQLRQLIHIGSLIDVNTLIDKMWIEGFKSCVNADDIDWEARKIGYFKYYVEGIRLTSFFIDTETDGHDRIFSALVLKKSIFDVEDCGPYVECPHCSKIVFRSMLSEDAIESWLYLNDFDYVGIGINK